MMMIILFRKGYLMLYFNERMLTSSFFRFSSAFLTRETIAAISAAPLPEPSPVCTILNCKFSFYSLTIKRSPSLPFQDRVTPWPSQWPSGRRRDGTCMSSRRSPPSTSSSSRLDSERTLWLKIRITSEKYHNCQSGEGNSDNKFEHQIWF